MNQNETNELELTKQFIIKEENLEELEKEINKKFYRHKKDHYSGVSEKRDFEKGCVPTPRDSEFFRNDILTFLYVATYVDKHDDKRPENFKWVFPDKKIGIAFDVEDRMKQLQREISSGRKGTKTHTPIRIVAQRCWKISQSDCFRFERYMHSLLEERWVEGEWYTDYNEDLINIIVKEIDKFVNNGGEVIDIDIDDDMREHIHRFEKEVETKNEKDFSDTIVYRL